MTDGLCFFEVNYFFLQQDFSPSFALLQEAFSVSLQQDFFLASFFSVFTLSTKVEAEVVLAAKNIARAAIANTFFIIFYLVTVKLNKLFYGCK